MCGAIDLQQTPRMQTTGPDSNLTAAESAAAGGANSTLELGINIPPLSIGAARLAATLQALALAQPPQDLSGYASTALLERYQSAVVAWMSTACGLPEQTPPRIIACHGARSGLALALQHLLPEGGRVLCDAVTYEGFKQLAAALRLELQPLAVDAQGCTPDSLDSTAESSGARVWLACLSLQNPLGSVASAQRRQALAEIARRRGLWVVEDDVYAALLPPAPALGPLAGLLPERCFHVGSLSKALAPALAAGWVLAPPAEADALRRRCYALGLSPGTWSALAFCRLQESGEARAIATEIRAELKARHALAVDILGGRRLSAGSQPAPHLWLPLAPGSAEAMHAQLLAQGLRLTEPSAPLLQPEPAPGLRLCIGAAPSRALLIGALEKIRQALDADGADASA